MQLTHIVCSFPSLIENAFFLRVAIGLSARFLKKKQKIYKQSTHSNVGWFQRGVDRGVNERGVVGGAKRKDTTRERKK